MRPCSAILLAGGESRRMGRDKALLPFGPEALAERLYRLLAASCAEVVVVRSPERGFPVPAARLVPDRHPNRGPLEGIASGLEALNGERALVVACDMPFLTQPVIERIMAFDPDTPALVPRSDRGLEPLLGVYACSLVPHMRRRLEEGERRLQRLLEEVGFRELPATALADLDPQGRTFWNLNHPEAYQAALRVLESDD